MKLLKGLALAALLQPCPSAAQVLGTWNGYLPYQTTVSVTSSSDWVYASTGLAYLQYHRSDQFVITRHKANGLSDLGSNIIAYDSVNQLLVVTYSNGNIDLVKDDSVRNVSDIKSASIVGKKSINHIHLDGDLAYLSCSFGIVVLDLVRAEIRDTYKPDSVDTEVLGAATTADEIFALTENGLFKASLMGSNLLDYHSWTKQKAAVNFHDTSGIDTGMIVPFAATVIATQRDTLMKYDTATGLWSPFYHAPGWTPVNLSVSEDQLIVVEHQVSGTTPPLSSRITIVQTDGSAASHLEGIAPVPEDALLTGDGYLWVADGWQGLKRYHIPSASLESIVPNGPTSNDVFALDARNGTLWVAAGAVDGSLNLTFNQNCIFSFTGWWTNYNWYTTPALDSTFDWITVKIDPNDAGRIYFGSHLSGLCILDDGTFTIYDQYNSPLQGFLNQTHVGAFGFDASGNLWISNHGAAKPLVVRKTDGTWVNLPVPSSSKDIFEMAIDDFGQVWVLTPRSPSEGLVVYNPGSDLENTGDDRSKVLTTAIGNGALPTNSVLSIAKDLDGEIWVGTNEGIAVFRCPGEILNDGCDADRIIVEKDGFLGYLLEAEVIFDIAIDGANRKWIGTDNGVFLLSEDGREEIHHFTESNSPLFSNTITDIAIDHSTGMVWIGTGSGLNSYQGDAVEGAPTHDCFIYPNPVRPDYQGPIVIRGLVRDADVRITDVAGNLVYHTVANGGMATWDGKLLDGSKARTGVYYVFSTNSDGSDRTVCKLVLVH